MPASAIFMPEQARRNDMEYFYEHESELFTFYRVPKVLFTEESFKNMNCEAKLLYGLLLDKWDFPAKAGGSISKGAPLFTMASTVLWRTWAAPTTRRRSCYPNWSKLACCAGNGRGWGSRLHCTL